MNKVVDSQAAIDAINNHFGFNIEEEYGSAVQEVINSLPPAQLEIIRCEDCIHYYGEPGNPNIICFQMHEDDFCSYGERRKKINEN